MTTAIELKCEIVLGGNYRTGGCNGMDAIVNGTAQLTAHASYYLKVVEKYTH